MKFSYKKTAAAVILFTLVLTVILILIAHRNEKTVDSHYTLKSYNGTVALYCDNEIVTVYDGIVLSTLPYEDRARFSEGITVQNPTDAQIIVEDYDG